MGVTLVVPMYNEAVRIGALLRNLEMLHAESPDLIYKIILVDDHSKDASIERAMRYARKMPLEIVALRENQGKWGAIMAGIEHARNDLSVDVVLITDADGSVDVTKNLLVVAESLGKGDAIWGSRFAKGASVEGKSSSRQVMSFVYRKYVALCYRLAGGRQKIDDMQCPLKIFHVDDLVGKMQTKRFAGDVEFALRLQAKRIVNLSVQFHHYGGSKISAKAVYNMLVETPSAAKRGSAAAKLRTESSK